MKRVLSSLLSSSPVMISALATLGVAFASPACSNASGTGFSPVEGKESDSTILSPEEKLADCNVPPKLENVVIGYVPSWVGDVEGLFNSLDLDTLTHVYLAFTNPSATDGKTHLPHVEDAVLSAFVTKAHNNNVKVLASIGGINDSELIHSKLGEDKVDAYVDDLERYMNEFDLDGIDVDIEGGSVDATYGPFVRKLADRIRPQGKLVTAAVAGWFEKGITDQALFCFDFINEMSYDAQASTASEHASRSYAEGRARYWNNTRKYPAERIVIGMPFYGYCWGSDCARPGGQIRYSSIVSDYSPSDSSDWVRPEGLDVEINYNSPETITYKTQLSHEYGGVMIWEMSQDTADQRLLQAVKAGL